MSRENTGVCPSIAVSRALGTLGSVFLFVKSEELFSYQDHIAGLELNFVFDLDKGSVSATFIGQNEASAAAHDPRVASGHESIVGKGDFSRSSADHGFVIEIVDIALLPALHDQIEPSSDGLYG